jgi:uracil permease
VLFRSGGRLAFAVTKDVTFELAGVALATVVGIILNLIFPASKGTAKTNP